MDGQIIAQEDQLDVPSFGWREGDVFAQVNHLNLPDDASGTVWIQIGLYNLDSGTRLPVIVNNAEVDQRLLLKPLEIKRTP